MFVRGRIGGGDGGSYWITVSLPLTILAVGDGYSVDCFPERVCP